MINRLQKVEKAINSMSDEKFSELLNDLGVKEEKQWKPEYDKRYFYVDDLGQIDYTMWKNDGIDYYRLLMKNVFKTEEEAKAQSDFNIEKAKLIKEIKDSSNEIDWEDENQSKYQLVLVSNTLEINTCYLLLNQGTTYTTNRVFLENLIKNEPERVKKYLFGIGGEK